MKHELKQAFSSEMAAAIGLYRRGEFKQAFKHLEVAHVLGQRYVIPHVISHWWMLKIGVRHRSAREVFGQGVRIVLGALGSAIGIVPTGNTGGTDISMFKRLPIDRALLDVIGK
ncbi:DUF3703 domain-containing protein [Noviherbaspirillum saxi]|uniref:DUF3703 domain-containing protein n=1 Tax=Noviherbaspirillum saxi TaxID=2320863 RepID=A0A3A3FG49_9BURK|nr:DUF3703 domain-containing protein [Noviherbaspirillum saxi]RJF92356.1 DUF3703 domain-containing protein [Noviherbaspirillum saxi]